MPRAIASRTRRTFHKAIQARPDPIKELDKEIDRKLSICRGC